LPEKRVEQVSRSAELFLRHDPKLPAASVFKSLGLWIRIDHRLEPFLKDCKERALEIVRLWNKTGVT
jgi:hypothetical protein